MFVYSFLISGACALTTFFALIWSMKMFPDGYTGFNIFACSLIIAVTLSHFCKGFSKNHYEDGKTLNSFLMQMEGKHKHLVESYKNTLNNSIKNTSFATFLFGFIYFLDTGDYTGMVLAVMVVACVLGVINFLGLPYATDKRYLYPYFGEAIYKVNGESFCISGLSLLVYVAVLEKFVELPHPNIFFTNIF